MTVNDYKKEFLLVLPEFYDEMERLNVFYLVMEFVLNFTKADCVLNGNEVISAEKQSEINQIVLRLQNNEPIQYITGKGYFFGYEFKVTPNTLIPRPETEELVDWVLTEMIKQPNKNWRVLDIGTGTGCIPITIKKEYGNSEVSAIDVSKEALVVAKENAQLLNAEVTFIEKDILTAELLDSYDIIISNPPYVRNLEKVEIHENVLQHEPHLALFVDDHDPLIFYRKITELAHENLAENGMLFFEINQYLKNEMDEMMKFYFKTIEFRTDFIGNNRMMKANNKIY